VKTSLILWVLVCVTACFDKALPAAALPVVACAQSDECPSELPICAQSVSRCVAADTVCLEPNGVVAQDGNDCGGGNICVSGACVVARCGDGIRSTLEECDDGNDVDTDACHGCITSTCGDGIVWEGEELCDSPLDCDACAPVACVGITQRCTGTVAEDCQGGTYVPFGDCSRLADATCETNDIFAFCVPGPSGQCFNGELFAGCFEAVCTVTGPTDGTCIAGDCANAGSCVGDVFQKSCGGFNRTSIDCAALNATCQQDRGCVVLSDRPCTPAITVCDIDGDRVEVCPASGSCPSAFVDGDGNTRTSPVEVTLPSTTIFDITPARDQDCVLFSIDSLERVRFSTAMADVNCRGQGGGDPAIAVFDAVTGDRVLESDDVDFVNYCARSATNLNEGSYVACVFESAVSGSVVLLDVTLSVSAVAIPDVALPYTATLDLGPEASCFSFVLDSPSVVTVDAGVDEAGCLESDESLRLDTLITLGEQRVDDNNDSDYCAVLTTEAPLPAGRHIACVSSFQNESNVPLIIRTGP
jgi:cysteine-rich repeat protein